MPRILIENRQKKRLNLARLSRTASRILKCLGEAGSEASLVLVTNREISRLNRQYLSSAGPTDVLAFPMRGGKEKKINQYLLGDVVISIEKAVSQARAGGEPFEKELTRLLIHGLLHLAGFRDSRKAERMKMISRQEKILSLVYPVGVLRG